MPILFDPWERKGVYSDSLPTPTDSSSVENGDYIINIHNGKESYKPYSGGGGGGVLIVHDVDGTLDKTWKEINDALAGAVVLIVEDDGYGGHMSSHVISAYDEEGEYAVVADTKPSGTTYTTDSENGYPSSEAPK